MQNDNYSKKINSKPNMKPSRRSTCKRWRNGTLGQGMSGYRFHAPDEWNCVVNVKWHNFTLQNIHLLWYCALWYRAVYCDIVFSRVFVCIAWYQLLLFVFNLCSHPVCRVWSDLLYACLSTCLACALQSCDQQNDRESSACARGLNSTGSRGLSARTFWKSYSERCLSSYCWVVSRLCIDTLWNFSATLPRNGTLLFNVGHLLWACRVDVNVVAHRSTSSRGVLNLSLIHISAPTRPY